MRVWCRPSFRGAAYLASANFMARAVILLGNFIHSLFSYEMILLYGAHLDTHILLFFQAVFMIPVFLLGSLIFFGIEKESFNIVLYPTLMLLFLVLLRYGAELALLIIHWEEHKFNQGPHLIYYLIIDILSVGVLLFYVYFSLASAPAKEVKFVSPHLVEGGGGGNLIEAPLVKLKPPKPIKVKKQKKSKKDSEEEQQQPNKVLKRKKAPAPPPEEEESKNPTPPPRPPPSPKFNYKLRRNIGQLPKDSKESVMIQELDKQRQRNSQILLKEDDEEIEELEVDCPSPRTRQKTQSLKVYDAEPKRRSLLIETDLDAEVQRTPTPTTSTSAKQEVDGPEVSKVPDPEVKAEEEEDESEWEYEYEEEEEEEVKKDDPPQVTEVKGQPTIEEPTTSSSTTTKSYKTTAV